jgi:MFS family permease
MAGSRARRLGAFGSLAGNRALVRVVGGYVLFALAQYSVWVAMLVYAYHEGGAAIAGLVALAQLAPAAVLAPIAAAVADRRSPVVLLAGVTWCRRRGWPQRPWRSSRACRWRRMGPRWWRRWR